MTEIKAIGLNSNQWALVAILLYHALEDLELGKGPHMPRELRALAAKGLWKQLTPQERKQMFDVICDGTGLSNQFKET